MIKLKYAAIMHTGSYRQKQKVCNTNTHAEILRKRALALNYSRWCILYTIFTNSAPPFYFEILQAASAIYPLTNSTGML